MPITPDYPSSKAAQEVAQQYRKSIVHDRSFTLADIAKIVQAKQLEFISANDTNMVFSPKDHTRKWWKFLIKAANRQDIAISIQYVRPELASAQKEKFYAHKILAILFPHNFPKVHTYFGSQDYVHDQLTGRIEERIHPHTQADLQVKYPLAAVGNIIAELGIPVRQLDTGKKGNTIVDDEGAEYFVAEIQLSGRGSEWDEEKIFAYMSARTEEYTENQIRQVMNCIARLRSLREKKTPPTEPDIPSVVPAPETLALSDAEISQVVTEFYAKADGKDAMFGRECAEHLLQKGGIKVLERAIDGKYPDAPSISVRFFVAMTLVRDNYHKESGRK